MARDEFDRYLEEMPEPKLELLDGRLVVGNGAGNMQLLQHLLEGWGAEAALPMAPAELWWQALAQGFRQFGPPAPQKPVDVWQAWAAQLTYALELPPAGPMVHVKHRAVQQALMMGLYRVGDGPRFADVSGRDVVMRLGADAFTPDVFAVGSRRCGLLNKHYLDGPADLGVEVLLPGHEAYDLHVKRPRYEAGNVLEFWIADPVQRVMTFLRLTGGAYRPCAADADGTYRSVAFPGLVFRQDLLWKETDDWGHGPNPFSVEGELPSVPKGFAEGGVAWGDLPFDPQPGLEPRALSFEEFASWAPRAKFECLDGKPWVGGSLGSRNVLGMLFRTEGLAKAVTVLHPSRWVAALQRAENDRAGDAARRQQWWQVARKVAALLRTKMQTGRLLVIGDLIQPRPLNLWSMLSLIGIDSAKELGSFETYRWLREHLEDEPTLHLVKYEHATRAEQEQVEAGGVDI